GGAEGHDVVVVELEAVAVALGQAADALQGRQLGPGLIAERVPATVLQAPDAEGKLVFLGGRVEMGWHVDSLYRFGVAVRVWASRVRCSASFFGHSRRPA